MADCFVPSGLLFSKSTTINGYQRNFRVSHVSNVPENRHTEFTSKHDGDISEIETRKSVQSGKCTIHECAERVVVMDFCVPTNSFLNVTSHKTTSYLAFHLLRRTRKQMINNIKKLNNRNYAHVA